MTSKINQSFATLEDEYHPKYCLQLEAAYGEGMMSDGGLLGIEHMFDQIPIKGKTALDIGSGLGGVAFYLAETHDMHVTGLDVNSWMISESIKRIPKRLKKKVSFVLSTSNGHWPLPSKNYDIIYSKGVFTHIEEKNEPFQECHRLLKDEGLFIICDWLSSEDQKWGKNIAKLVELENLVLFPVSENTYIELLKKNGFDVLSVRDDTEDHIKSNQEIINRLQSLPKNLSNLFTTEELEASVLGYESIVKAFQIGELITLRFVCKVCKGRVA